MTNTSAMVSAKDTIDLTKESDIAEVKSTLIKKIKQFRDLIHIY